MTFKLFKNGRVLFDNQFRRDDLLVVNNRIIALGDLDDLPLKKFDTEVIDCSDCILSPGFIDPHIHLGGGSGETGFRSQPLPILFTEIIEAGITSVVGTLGVDTSTRTMEGLIASVKAFREVGLSAYAYTGGYPIPPRTLTKSVRDDILFIEEIIGAGEVSIADRRAPEPPVKELARVVIDAYVGGMLSNKAGVTHFHVGEGRRRLQTIRELIETEEIVISKIYVTHLDRSPELIREGAELAKKGAFVDFDVHERNLAQSYKVYRECGGPAEQMSFSSDAGLSSPGELWDEVRKCSKDLRLPIESLLLHKTRVPARALGLKNKGALRVGMDADILVLNNNLDVRDLVANGQFLLRNGAMQLQQPLGRRRMDLYGIRNKIA